MNMQAEQSQTFANLIDRACIALTTHYPCFLSPLKIISKKCNRIEKGLKIAYADGVL